MKALLEEVAARAPVQANRLFQLVRAAFRWAVREGFLESSPADGLMRPRPERSRERFLSDGEIKALWSGLETLSPVVAAAIRTLLLTGQRRTETLRMRWVDVNLAEGVWTIPGEFRKGGRTHVVPLSPLVVEMLEALRPSTGAAQWVFAGRSGAAVWSQRQLNSCSIAFPPAQPATSPRWISSS